MLNVMLEILDGFSRYEPWWTDIKVRLFTSDFKFWIGVNLLVVDIPTQILLNFFDFHCFTNFAKNINLS